MVHTDLITADTFTGGEPWPAEKLVAGPAGKGPVTTAFGYDAVVDKHRRKPPKTGLLGEDAQLSPRDRKKLLGSVRDLRRNLTICAWAIRKHLDYVSSFSFQSRTGNEELNDRIEELMEWWSRPRNCDVAKRHSLPRMIRLLEECRTIDGDVFLLKLSDGRLQAIEGDRIQTPSSGVPRGLKASKLTHGVQTDSHGAAEAYCVCKRTPVGSYKFERFLRAGFVVHHGFFDRFDQVRGISPLAGAINAFQDVYEATDYALAKMKVAQLFGLIFYRNTVEAVAAQTTGSDSDRDGREDSEQEVDFGRGPVQLDLEIDEKAEWLESKTPAPEFGAFLQKVIAAGLKALDLPYSFFDESFTNYSGSRQALLQYEQSAEVKRGDVRMLLNDITAWRLRAFVQDGVLELPADIPVERLRWEWIPRGIPWIDPLKEVNADVQAIGAALSSRTRVLRRQGLDFGSLARELAAENKVLDELGLPTRVTPANVQIDEIAPEKG